MIRRSPISAGELVCDETYCCPVDVPANDVTSRDQGYTHGIQASCEVGLTSVILQLSVGFRAADFLQIRRSFFVICSWAATVSGGSNGMFPRGVGRRPSLQVSSRTTLHDGRDGSVGTAFQTSLPAVNPILLLRTPYCRFVTAGAHQILGYFRSDG